MRLLLTNDDGVFAPGLHALAVALAGAGHEVRVVAPTTERSGASAGIGYLANGVEFDVTAHPIPDADGIPTFALDGPPALCVMLSMFEVFGERPDLVVAGINLGANCGRVVLSSGTVGAALLGQSFGLSALAVSQHDDGGPMHWATAAEVAVRTVGWLADAPPKTLLNLNVPNVELAALRGVRWGRLAAFGSTSTSVTGSVPGTVRIHITPREVALKPDTDTHLLDAGYATITGLVGVRAEQDVSATAAPAVEAALDAALNAFRRPVG
jgi:5'-nucleotidase